MDEKLRDEQQLERYSRQSEENFEVTQFEAPRHSHSAAELKYDVCIE